ncbi:MAG: hypothetical protein RLN62_04935 [Rickettsiales bacterium]
MFKYSDTYKSSFITNVRNAVYCKKGFFIIKDFIAKDIANNVINRWLSEGVEYYFDDFYKNKDVNFLTPNYLIKRPTPNDVSFCINIYNKPIDQELNDITIEAQKFRNIVEQRPMYFGINKNDDLVLQYRLCRTISSGIIVKKHADFFEEPRHDPTGSHDFDPRRCQLTLILSDYGLDYKNGGFYFYDNDNKELLFGKDIKVKSGDLIIWKYSNTHSVRSVNALTNKGFSRIIFPQFDNIKNKEIIS